ncbi:hypothetical protein AMECASPLE_007365 [Ameca splendens]|uniref:Uncharacterized protein n=1 Tax=Ameca splendens TaxID=208324 RepID=A0ABV0YXK8_9TELE
MSPGNPASGPRLSSSRSCPKLLSQMFPWLCSMFRGYSYKSSKEPHFRCVKITEERGVQHWRVNLKMCCTINLNETTAASIKAWQRSHHGQGQLCFEPRHTSLHH